VTERWLEQVIDPLAVITAAGPRPRPSPSLVRDPQRHEAPAGRRRPGPVRLLSRPARRQPRDGRHPRRRTARTARGDHPPRRGRGKIRADDPATTARALFQAMSRFHHPATRRTGSTPTWPGISMTCGRCCSTGYSPDPPRGAPHEGRGPPCPAQWLADRWQGHRVPATGKHVDRQVDVASLWSWPAPCARWRIGSQADPAGRDHPLAIEPNETGVEIRPSDEPVR
jgi:hypothetical protein